MSTVEERFMVLLDSMDSGVQDHQPALGRLEAWWREFSRFCRDVSVPRQGLRPGGELSRQLQGVGDLLRASEQRWQEQWDQLRPAQTLASMLKDRIVVLVFGKFNAGKSSLCNFLAERFENRGRAVRHFRLADGRLVDCARRFEEGSVETTSALQGVFLGKGLVLLDTPGLHSETANHDALTRRFVESADGILWLSSATSPGQVQALDDLATELRRNKPLLPVLTRSDLIEEEERDGDIVKCLRNKTAEERAIQEQDVGQRAKERLQQQGLPAMLLKAPVSISVSACRQLMDQPEAHLADMASALAESGFDRLYEALLAMITPVMAYRHRKPVEVLMHHLKEHVLADLDERIMPEIDASRQNLARARDDLVNCQVRIVALAWRDVIPQLPDLLASHAGREDRSALFSELEASIQAAFVRQLEKQLPDHELKPSGTSAPVSTVTLEDDHRQDEVQSRDEEVLDRLAAGLHPEGCDPASLYEALQREVHVRLQDMASAVTKTCEATLDQIDAHLQALQRSLASSRRELLRIEAEMLPASGGEVSIHAPSVKASARSPCDPL